MNFPYFIARRVASNSERSFSRLIIRIAVAAVALSLAVMIAATALIAGFQNEISDKIFDFWGHIHITDPDMNQSLLEVFPIDKNQDFYPSLDTVTFVEYPVFDTEVGGEITSMARSRAGIRHIQVFAVKPGMIKVNNEIEGIILKGISDDFDWEFMDRYLQEGAPLALPDSMASSEIVISRQTAERLSLEVGDKFEIHFLQKGEQLRRRFTVSGIYKTGLDEYDRKFALVDIRQIQRLQGWTENEVGGFEVFVEDIEDLDAIANYIYYDVFPISSNLYAQTIEEKLPEIFEWLDLQDINKFVILTLMFIVAIINMVTALLILILERTNMIGILKALGSTSWNIRKIFLYHAAMIIVYGIILGNILGIGFCVLQEKFEFITLSEEDYYLSVAPVDLELWTVLGLNIGTLLIILIFLILPSYLVTSITPVKAIRFK